MTHSRKGQALFLVLLIFIVGTFAQAQERGGKVLSPYFFVLNGKTSNETFPLKSTDVTVEVNGVIAAVVVRQVYANEGPEPINARYVFPGSTRSSIHGMKITIGNQMVVAKIKEREQAKKEFERAKAEGKSASLLQQQRPNVFTMSVANIMPGDRVEVEFHYSELLVPTDGTYQFVYPTVVGPRYSNRPEAAAPETDRFVKSPYLPYLAYQDEEREASPTFDIQVALTTGLPLQEVGCSSHSVDVAWSGPARARVNLVNPSGAEGNRDFILEYRLAGREIQSGLMLYEGSKENFFLLMVQPPAQITVTEIHPREYIFVLDVSGSMNGFPLETAKSVIRDLIGNLREEDLFNVVLFAGGSRVLAPSSLAATQANIEEAIRVIENQSGGGATELVPALRTAVGLPRNERYSRTVVVITDGFIGAERMAFEVIQNNLNRTNFFCFGIGSSVNRFLVEGMARAGMGEPFVVTSPEAAASVTERFRKYVESPVLTNLAVSFKGFEVYDVEPPVLPDLFA
ncbi:MAG: VIT and VWA domain-containing protein, partial [Acidobacteriota bacterium]